MLTRILVALLLGLAAGPADAAPIEITSSPVDLYPDNPRRQTIGKLRYMGGLVLRSPERRFGGLSALLVDGLRLTAVSDRGDLLRAAIELDGDGRLVGLRDGDLAPLRDGDDQRLLDKESSDAESLARGDGGALWVGFERNHRIMSFAPPAGTAPAAAAHGDLGPGRPVDAPRALALAPSNGGLETLTRLNDGRYLAIAERMAGTDGNAAWIGGGGQPWRPLAYAVSDNFFPTGAATLPGGDVLVLERFFTLVAGVAVRLRLLAAADLKPGAVLRGELLAEFAAPATVDNFEGVSVGRGPGGRVMVYIVSDDNFNVLQRTLLLAFTLVVD
ncbi:MAG: esterase-like activity of phytase family protein [Hyphomicrobiales bacterium]|nr:esterase-like activity of phytase family protein [Hyphomicrobiales bacterium]